MPSQPINEAQLRLAAIVSSSDDAIISKDLTGTITSWNRAAERIFGYTEAEAVGRSIHLIVPPELYPEEDEVLSRIVAGRTVAHYTTERVRKDGRRIRVSLTVSPIVTPDGEVIGASKIARDDSERDRMQRDAFRLAAIVDSSDDAIVSKNLDGIVTSWNRAAEAIFGFTAQEMIGHSIRRLIPADRQQEEDDVLARIRRGERVEHYETIRLRKDGTSLPVSLTVSPIRSENGVVIGASKIARDIRERKRAEQERQHLLTVAQEASRLKDEFLATLSHELRTPLNAILGYIRMMRLGLLNEEKQRKALDTVGRNALSLTQIVEDVLDVSRIVSGKIRLDVQRVELPTVIREALETVRPAIEAKELHVETVLDPAAPPVLGDPERLRQVLWNLLSNAVKFTEQGGRIEVRLAREGTRVVITVSDTGIGIPAEFLPHVFDRFRQADAGITRAHGGLGLGLAIARHLVELQGGHITAASEGRGKGTTVRVELPVKRAKAAARPDEPGRDRRTGQSADVTVPDLNGVRVLVVDDEPDALSLAREVLECAGATVSTAASAAAALEMIEQLSVDVLIADLGMPLMNGFDLMARIRQSPDPRVREVAAAALTAYARSEDRVRALSAGFQMHLSKPIEPGALMDAVAILANRASFS